ncbi:leucine-rich repeat domain-containing protein, partial [uncultured Microscilla sp.]|uniref:leucine-rich repeat domain-containing protein n=1 Tax=uncultured Microscilla sp. TaxID=432653 RepID=UPI002611F9FE
KSLKSTIKSALLLKLYKIQLDIHINNIKLGGFVGMIGILAVSWYAIQFSGKSGKKTMQKALPKSSLVQVPCKPQKTAFRVDVAHFNPKRPSFAVKLVSKIKQGVPLAYQTKVAVEKYNDYFFNKAKPALEVDKLIAKTCQYRGLVVYGDRNAQSGEESLTCWIEVVNVKKQITHQLEEPPASFKFSIPNHAHYVSYFISGLIKYYLHLNDEAQKDFGHFLKQIKSSPKASNHRVIAYCKIYLGKIAIEKGNKTKALRLFQEAHQLYQSDFNGKNILALSEAIQANKQMLEYESEAEGDDDDRLAALNSTSIAVDQNNPQSALPITLTNPDSVIKLDLRNRGLTKVPSSITRLSHLARLYFTRNRLTTLPVSLAQLKKLTHLFCRYNSFEVFPEVLTQMTQLKYLYLKSNRLKSIPAGIKKMTGLVSLHLQNNQISKLPPEIAQLKKLKWLYLKGNPISAKERALITSWLPDCKVIFE